MLSTVTAIPNFTAIQLVLGNSKANKLSLFFYILNRFYVRLHGFQMSILKQKLMNVITDRITHESKYTLHRTKIKAIYLTTGFY